MTKAKNIFLSGYINRRHRRRTVLQEIVDAFNKKYDGKYFADIEFIPRNDMVEAIRIRSMHP